MPTVTLCPKNMNPDRWGPTIKIFDYVLIWTGSVLRKSIIYNSIYSHINISATIHSTNHQKQHIQKIEELRIFKKLIFLPSKQFLNKLEWDLKIKS